MAHINIVCVCVCVDFLNVKEGGTCNYHCALKCRTLRHSAFLPELHNTAVTGLTRILKYCEHYSCTVRSSAFREGLN